MYLREILLIEVTRIDAPDEKAKKNKKKEDREQAMSQFGGDTPLKFVEFLNQRYISKSLTEHLKVQ